jgi:hypothetical protein
VSNDNIFKTFVQFASTGNRMLLWHGSRLSNWAGILSQGNLCYLQLLLLLPLIYICITDGFTWISISWVIAYYLLGLQFSKLAMFISAFAEISMLSLSA